MVAVWRKAYRQLGERTVPVRVVAALAGILLIGGLVMAGSAAWVSSSRAARTTVVGYVDVDRVLDALVEDPIQQETERLQKEFDEKAKGLNEEERQRLFIQYQQMLYRRDQELRSAQLPRVRQAIASVAEEQKLELVFHAGAVWWGGQDITPQVLAKLGVRTSERPGNPSGSGSGSSGAGGASGGQGARSSGK